MNWYQVPGTSTGTPGVDLEVQWAMVNGALIRFMLYMPPIHFSWYRRYKCCRLFQRSYGTTLVARAKPLKRKTSSAQIDAFPTVNIYCNTCSLHIFRYKKKNGTKSGLVKCYIERIIEDCAHILRDQYYKCSNNSNNQSSRDEQREQNYFCPQCRTTIARYSMVHGLPALKCVGGKIRMAKK